MRKKNFIAGLVLFLTLAVALSSAAAFTLSSRADSGVSLYACPDKTVYIVGQTVDTSGAKLLVGGNTVNVTADMLTEYSTDSVGVKTVGIKYNGETVAHFDIEVVENFVVTLTVKTKPAKLYFGKDDTFSADGGTLTAVWYDGAETTVGMTDDGVALSGYTSTVSGRQLVTVKYAGGVTSYYIEVEGAPKKADEGNVDPGKEPAEKKGCKSAALAGAASACTLALLGAAIGLAVRRTKNA